jgi:alpha-N-arabinofuranosidase
MNATIHLDTNHNVGEIDRRIFGGFLEHLGRAIYQGVYDPGNPLSDANGFRLDVIGKLRELRMPIMRYPGGNFVSAYDWRDGIGPRDKRPSRPDFAWKSIEPNQFGTDEFMQWCKMLGTEPMMAVNLGTAGAREAGELLEYCNLTIDTKWAQLRKQHGHAEPYGVKVWCLGNEMDGQWQAGHCTAMEYARRARQASCLMKGLDKNIQTVICGSSGRFMKTYMQWDREVLEECWETADFISAHRYSDNHRNDSAWFLAEGVEIDQIIRDYSGLVDYARGKFRSNKQVYLSFDEWNVWYRQRGGDGGWKESPHLLEEVYNLEDALVCAQYLNAFIRRADFVKMACLAQIVNVIAPIMTNKNGLLIQSIFYPIEMISKNAAGISLHPRIECATYPAGERGDVPAIDASATFDSKTGDASFFIVNRDARQPATVTLKLADRKITRIISGEGVGGQDVRTANSWESPNEIKRFAVDAKLIDGGIEVLVQAPGFAAVKVATSPA